MKIRSEGFLLIRMNDLIINVQVNCNYKRKIYWLAKPFCYYKREGNKICFKSSTRSPWLLYLNNGL